MNGSAGNNPGRSTPLAPHRFILAFGTHSQVAAERIRHWLATPGPTVVPFDRPQLMLLGTQPWYQRWLHLFGLNDHQVSPPRMVDAVEKYFAETAEICRQEILRLAGIETGSADGSVQSGWLNFPPDFGDQTLLRSTISAFDFASGREAGAPPVDLFKGLYHHLMPRPLRHALGEYYTPNWLAEFVLDAVGFQGDPQRRLIDPTCGSGTFLLLALHRIRRRAAELGLEPRETLRLIAANIAGVDVHPLAVAAARANVTLAAGDLLRSVSDSASLNFQIVEADVVLEPPELGTFDFAVGNPPWIGWETLPEEYRRRSLPLWRELQLFPHAGMDVVLGKGKKDLAMLVAYAVTKKYVRDSGRLGLVFPIGLLRSAGAGRGFRRFQFGKSVGDAVGIESVDDFSRIGVFVGASTKCGVLVWTRGRFTEFPIPYGVWRAATPRTRFADEDCWRDADQRLEYRKEFAEPVDCNDPASSWIAASRTALPLVRRLLGPSDYQAREGVNTGGANGVFWLEPIDGAEPIPTARVSTDVSQSGENIGVESSAKPRSIRLFRNIAEAGKHKVESRRSYIETELVYPLLRGNDVGRWRAEPSTQILFVQDPVSRRGLPESLLRQSFPSAYAHLQHFESHLRRRAAYRRYFFRKRKGVDCETGPFYSMFNAGEYTLAPYKTVWRRMVAPLAAAAVGPIAGRAVLPQETHGFVACTSMEEANYLASVLNSKLIGWTAAAGSVAGSKAFGSPNLLEWIAIPRFVPGDAAHMAIAERGRFIAGLPPEGRQSEESLLDRQVAMMFGFSEEDSVAILGTLDGES